MADPELKQENCIKLLGVTIDNKLTFMDTLLAYAAKLVDKLVYLIDSNVLSL